MQRGLEIIVNEENLILPPDIAIPWFTLNPATNDQGDHSFNFEIDDIPENSKILEWPARLTTKENVVKLNTVLKFDGLLIYKGSLNVLPSNAGKISLYFVTNSGDFKKNAKEINMKDVDYGSDIVLGTTASEVASECTARVAQSYPDTECNFPVIYNPDFYGEDKASNPDYWGWQNGGWDYVNEWFGSNVIHEDPAPDNVATFTPFFYLLFVLDKLFSFFGFYIKGPFTADVEVQKILLYNNWDLSRKVKKYYVRAKTESDRNISWDTSVANYRTFLYLSDIISYPNEDVNVCLSTQNSDGYHTVPYTRYTIQEEGYYKIKLHLIINNTDNNGNVIAIASKQYPMVYYWETWNLGYLATGQTIHDLETSFWIGPGDIGEQIIIGIQITNAIGGLTLAVESDSYIIISNESHNSLNQYGLSIHPSDCMPDKSVNDFLNLLKLNFGLVPYVNNVKEEAYLTTLKQIIDGLKVNDLTDKMLQSVQTEIKKYKTTFGFTFPDTSDELIDISNYISRGIVNTVDDIPDPVNPMEYVLVLNTNNIHITYWDDTLLKITWKLYTHNFIDVVMGDNTDNSTSEEWRPEASPTQMNQDTSEGIKPKTMQVGNSKDFDMGSNGFDIEFMIYHGLRESKGGYTYPFASSLKYDDSASEIGDLNLTAEDLIDRFFGSLFTKRSILHKPFTWYINFTIVDLINLHLWEKFKIAGTVCIIDRMDTTIRMHGIDPCKTTFLPL
jgi:hypothetical protein